MMWSSGAVARAVLIASFASACATPPPPRPVPEVLTKDVLGPWKARAQDLLRRLVAINASAPQGAPKAAAEVVHSFLLRSNVQAEMVKVDRNRWAVWGRVEAGEAQGPPIVLLSHLDTETIHRAAWPRETPPLALTERDDTLWGAGVEGGKALATLHATSLAILAQVGGPKARDVHLVAIPDGLSLSSGSLDKVIRRFPSVATATVALAGGGSDVLDWFGDGRTVQAITVGERGTTVIQVAAVAGAQSGGLPSSERLARALVAIEDRPQKPRSTPINRALLDAAARGLSAPSRWLLGSSVGQRVFAVPDLIARPYLRAQFFDTLTTVRIQGGRPRGTTTPVRSRALLRAQMLDDQTPGGLARELRTAIADPTVHVTVRASTASSLTGPQDRWMRLIRAAARVKADAVTVPILGAGPRGWDALRGADVPVFGYAPWTRRPEQLGPDGPQSVGTEEFREAIKRMAALVFDLSAE